MIELKEENLILKSVTPQGDPFAVYFDGVPYTEEQSKRLQAQFVFTLCDINTPVQ